jgi:hypothetical protein
MSELNRKLIDSKDRKRIGDKVPVRTADARQYEIPI